MTCTLAAAIALSPILYTTCLIWLLRVMKWRTPKMVCCQLEPGRGNVEGRTCIRDGRGLGGW